MTATLSKPNQRSWTWIFSSVRADGVSGTATHAWAIVDDNTWTWEVKDRKWDEATWRRIVVASLLCCLLFVGLGTANCAPELFGTTAFDASGLAKIPGTLRRVGGPVPAVSLTDIGWGPHGFIQESHECGTVDQQ